MEIKEITNGNDSTTRVDGNNCNDADCLLFSLLRDNPSAPVNPIYKTRRGTHKVFKKPSQVIPHQTYTVRELFERAVLNSMPDGIERSYFAEDTTDVDELFNRSGIDLTTLDLVELDDYKSKIGKKIDEMKTQMR